MADISKIESMGSDELSVLLDTIDKERQRASSLLDTVAQEKLEKERDIAILKISIQKAKQNLRDLNVQKEITERCFWRNKNR